MGFAMIECGSIRAKNAKSILVKNMFDSMVGFIGFWVIGYAIAYGDVKEFMGGGVGAFYASAGFERLSPDNYLSWVF
jgi:Amt family ammonium transporter